MRDVRLSVPNMKCGGCVTTVADALSGVDGAQDVVVDLESKIAQITVPQGLSDSDLIQIVEASGFTAARVD